MEPGAIQEGLWGRVCLGRFGCGCGCVDFVLGHHQQHSVALAWSPFLSLKAKGDTRHRDGGKDPTALLDPARLVIYRPTGTSNIGLRHPSQPGMRCPGSVAR
jgi:hypothetical protein